MTWVVDTCIILDILDRHPMFAEMSSCALQSKLDDVMQRKRASVYLSSYLHQGNSHSLGRDTKGGFLFVPIAEWRNG